MLLIIQIPLADSRFLIKKNSQLNAPTWPLPEINKEFVRRHGNVEDRPLGGVTGIGECSICEARNALKFNHRPRYFYTEKDYRTLPVRFRRLFVDSFALVKYEIGLYISDIDDKEGLIKIISDLLNTSVRVKGIIDSTTPLLDVKKFLSQSYLMHTTELNRIDRVPSWFVLPCNICAFLVSNEGEINISDLPNQIEYEKLLLSYLKIRLNAVQVPVWILEKKNYEKLTQYDVREYRALRIALLRLHAENESFNQILSNIALNKITKKNSSNDLIDNYLNRTTKRILKLEARTDKKDISNVAKHYFYYNKPGLKESILDKVDSICTRKNIVRKVEDYLIHYEVNQYFKEEFYMVDQSKKVINIGDGNITNIDVSHSILEINSQITKSKIDPDLKKELENASQLLAELVKHIDPDLADGAKRDLETAVNELKSPKPRKTFLLTLLDNIKKIAEGAANYGVPIVSSILKIKDLLVKLFI